MKSQENINNLLKNYQVTKINIKDITPYARNAKKHDKVQIDNVAESIRQFGFVQPIVVDADKTVIIGHCRLLAAKKLKMEEVPVIIADNLSANDVSKLRNLDNKLNESDWDLDLLAADIDGLDFSDFEIDWGLPETISPNDFGDSFVLPDGEKQFCQMTFTLATEQKEEIERAIELINETPINYGNQNKNGNALYEIVRQWMGEK